MKLKKITLLVSLLFALALAASVFGQDKTEKTDKADTKGAPKLAVDNLKYEFGKVKEGDEITHVFKIKNEGTAELVIANVSPGCGCTASDFTKTHGSRRRRDCQTDGQNRRHERSDGSLCRHYLERHIPAESEAMGQDGCAEERSPSRQKLTCRV